MEDQVRQSTNNDKLRWCSLTLDGTQVYFAHAGHAELLYVPDTTLLKLRDHAGAVHTATADLTQDIVDNVNRSVQAADVLHNE